MILKSKIPKLGRTGNMTDDKNEEYGPSEECESSEDENETESDNNIESEDDKESKNINVDVKCGRDSECKNTAMVGHNNKKTILSKSYKQQKEVGRPTSSKCMGSDDSLLNNNSINNLETIVGLPSRKQTIAKPSFENKASIESQKGKPKQRKMLKLLNNLNSKGPQLSCDDRTLKPENTSDIFSIKQKNGVGCSNGGKVGGVGDTEVKILDPKRKNDLGLKRFTIKQKNGVGCSNGGKVGETNVSYLDQKKKKDLGLQMLLDDKRDNINDKFSFKQSELQSKKGAWYSNGGKVGGVGETEVSYSNKYKMDEDSDESDMNEYDLLQKPKKKRYRPINGNVRQSTGKSESIERDFSRNNDYVNGRCSNEFRGAGNIGFRSSRGGKDRKGYGYGWVMGAGGRGRSAQNMRGGRSESGIPTNSNNSDANSTPLGAKKPAYLSSGSLLRPTYMTSNK